MSKVFLLADEPGLRGVIESALRHAGHAAVSATWSDFRMSRLERFAPDVVILDTADEAGAAAVRLQMLRHSALATVPVVAIAASADEAKAFGAQAFLPRAVVPEDVGHVLDALSHPTFQQAI